MVTERSRTELVTAYETETAMIWQQRLDELKSYIEGLEHQLAEADAFIATHAYTIDKTPPDRWPSSSIIRAAMDRHTRRSVDIRNRIRAAGAR